MFSVEEIKRAYEKVHDLFITRQIINTYSTNQSDIRDLALQEKDLFGYRRILELGCGYGFFIKKLAGRLHKEASIIGVDLVEQNREPFLNSVTASGYCGEFIHGDAAIIRSMNTASFDCIITSYSLYFFPGLARDIARILKDNGIFIAITHSEHSLNEALVYLPQCLRSMGLNPPDDIMIRRLFSAFSAENGKALLVPHFRTVENINFKNSLEFHVNTIDDCLWYLAKKRSLIYKGLLDIDGDAVMEVEALLSRRIHAHAASHGIFSLNKDDAVFRCMGPNC